MVFVKGLWLVSSGCGCCQVVVVKCLFLLSSGCGCCQVVVVVVKWLWLLSNSYGCSQMVVVVVKWLWLLSSGCGCYWCQVTWSFKGCCCLCLIAVNDQPLPALPFIAFLESEWQHKNITATLCFSWLQDRWSSYSVLDNQLTSKTLHAWRLWFPSYKCTLLDFK